MPTLLTSPKHFSCSVSGELEVLLEHTKCDIQQFVPPTFFLFFSLYPQNEVSVLNHSFLPLVLLKHIFIYSSNPFIMVVHRGFH